MGNRNIEFENKKIIYDIKYNGDVVYEWDGVNSDTVKKLVPTQHLRILTAIKQAEEKRKELEEQKRKQEVKQENDERDKFEEELKQMPIIKEAEEKGYKLEVEKVRKIDSFYTKGERIFTLDGFKNRIYYEPKVYEKFGSHRTDKVWVLDFDYKGYRTTRYKSLETAIKKYIEKLDEERKEEREREKRKREEQKRIEAIKQWCEKNNLEFNKEYLSYGKYKYFGTSKQKRYNLNYEKGKVIVESIIIFKPTEEQIKKMEAI